MIDACSGTNVFLFPECAVGVGINRKLIGACICVWLERFCFGGLLGQWSEGVSLGVGVWV